MNIPLPVLLGLNLKKGTTDKLQLQIRNIRFWIRIALLTLPVAALLEALQLFIPFNINDLIANGVDVIMGLMLILIFRKLFSRI